MIDCMEEFGELIRVARERRGYRSQAALARRLDRDQSFVSRLERGAVKELPTPEVLEQVGDVLGLTMEEMLTAAGYLNQQPPKPSITIPRTDPRARLLELVAHVDDDDMETLIDVIDGVLKIREMRHAR